MTREANILINTAAYELSNKLQSMGINRRVMISIVEEPSSRVITQRITPQELIECVATTFGITVEKLREKNKKRYPVAIRQICMRLLFKYFKRLSLDNISHLVGLTDHATILYGIRKVQDMVELQDPLIYPMWLRASADVQLLIKNKQENYG